MRQTVLTAVVATLLITSAPHTAKAFFPIIGVAVGAGMVGGAMQDRSNRIEGNEASKASKASKATKANNTNEAKAPRKANTRKEPPEPNIRTEIEDDSKIAKESPPKAKWH